MEYNYGLIDPDFSNFTGFGFSAFTDYLGIGISVLIKFRIWIR